MKIPETLHYVDLFLWSDEQCQDAFANVDYFEMSESGSEICTYGVVSMYFLSSTCILFGNLHTYVVFVIYKIVISLSSFQGRDTKLDIFLVKNEIFKKK